MCVTALVDSLIFIVSATSVYSDFEVPSTLRSMSLHVKMVSVTHCAHRHMGSASLYEKVRVMHYVDHDLHSEHVTS